MARHRYRPEWPLHRNPIVDTAVDDEGMLVCPGCGERFSMKERTSWTGLRHYRCGQRIRVANVERQAEPVWALTANVVEHDPRAKDDRRGTRFFAPGAKVHSVRGPNFSGNNPDIIEVVGMHRGSKEYVSVVMRKSLLTNWRARRVYKIPIIDLLSPNWCDSSTETQKVLELYAMLLNGASFWGLIGHAEAIEAASLGVAEVVPLAGNLRLIHIEEPLIEAIGQRTLRTPLPRPPLRYQLDSRLSSGTKIVTSIEKNRGCVTRGHPLLHSLRWGTESIVAWAIEASLHAPVLYVEAIGSNGFLTERSNSFVAGERVFHYSSLFSTKRWKPADELGIPGFSLDDTFWLEHLQPDPDPWEIPHRYHRSR